MKKTTLFKTVLLLCALMVGSRSAWAETVTFDATKDVSANAQSYQSTEKSYTATDGSTWLANGYGATKNVNIIIGKGGANYLRTPEVDGTITSVAVTWSGNAKYYLALQTTDGTELEAKQNPSSPSTETFTISEGDYSQLQLVGRRSSGSENAAATITKVVVTYTPSGSGDKEDCDLALTGAPIALSFDLYNDDTKVINYTTTSTGTVTVEDNAYVDAVVDAVNKIITLTAKKVTASTQTITVNQAADDTYKSGSVTFTVSIDDSTPFVGGDVTFVGGTDTGTSTSQSADEVTKSVVTIASDKAGFAYAEYRIYSGSTTTISTSTGKITKIVFTQVSGSYPLSNLSVSAGDGTYSAGTWTGCASSVSFDADGQARASKIVVTVCPTVTLNSYGFASYCSPFALDLTPNSEFAAYAVAAAGDNALTFTKIPGKVAKETPIILYNPDKAGEAVCLPIIEDDDEDIEAVTGNELIGTLAPTSVTDVDGHTNFGLKGNKFVKFNAGTVAANKAYLCVDNSKISAEARELSIIFDDGETTGITEMKNIQSESRGGIYNLNGQLVAQPAKGLYIMNGKKVIIK